MDSAAIISITLGVISAVLSGIFQLQVRLHQEKMASYLSFFGRICDSLSVFSNFEGAIVLKCFALIGFGSSETIENRKLQLPMILFSSLSIGMMSGLTVYGLAMVLSLMSLLNWFLGIGIFVMIFGWSKEFKKMRSIMIFLKK